MSKFQSILNAVDKYAELTGINLKENPFADQVKDCDSPTAVLLLLQENVKEFRGYQDNNRKFIECISPVVQFVHALSGIIGEVAGLATNGLNSLTELPPGILATSSANQMPPRCRLGHNAPPDDDNPHTNLPPSFPARFMTVLELYRAQRDSPSQVQAALPSPTFRVQYQLDAPPVHHTLFAILSSQATVVSREEYEALRIAVPSPPETPTPEIILEAVERVIPSLSNEVIATSVQAMEQVLAHSSTPDNLELNDIPPEVWAALRTAVPARGSTLSDTISCASSFTEARDNSRSGASSPMDNSPTNANTPLFLAGSSSEGQLSLSYHPLSLEATEQLPHGSGTHQHPISVQSSIASDHQAITVHLQHAPASLEVLADRLTPPYQMPPDIYNTTLSLRSLASTPIGANPIMVITGENDRYFEAVGLMDTISDELNQAAEGHSHYFLREPLTILQDPVFPVQSEELCQILDLTAAALSVGPRVNNTDDIWRLLCPSDWYRAATHTLAAILRGCIRTKDISRLGNFPLHPLRDTYRCSNNLPTVDTQRDLLEALALQVAEQLSMDNGPYLLQDSVDGIWATVWRAHEAQIRAAVAMKANEVEHCLTTMGLSELIDNLLNKSTEEEITNTIREDIALQIRSKYNNKKLETENLAYHEMINQAMINGKNRAAKEALETYTTTSKNLREQKERQAIADMDKYYINLLEKAKEQARLKVDSEFARLLADKRSAIAPRVDTEITLEHKKLIAEHCLATEAQLNVLTTEEEKALVRTVATCLGMTLQIDEHTSKKVKVDQHKARPAPITPRGRSNSSVSSTSAQTTSRKRAYSPSEIAQEDAVNLAQDCSLTPSTPLRGLDSSIHNVANHMSIDPEHLDLANIFPPGIPPPPTNISLPTAMSQTPAFGGAEVLEDGMALSSSPEASITDTFEVRMLAMMAKFNQPIWDTIHRIEQALGNGRIPRILQRAGPGYRSEHIVNQAPRVSSIVTGPVVTTQETGPRQDNQAVPPFPSEPPVPERPMPSVTPLARVDDDEFPSLEPMGRRNRHKRNVAQAVIQLRRNIPGATGPDDGHLPITNNNSRIKPLFANVITQAAVARQQTVQQTAAQARAIQGHKQSGNQGTWKATTDSNLTEVTVIRFGGLSDEEEEHKFRARNLVEIIQSVQQDLARQTKNPPAVLSGRWSTTSNTTGNFVFTIAGIIPPRDLMALKPHLCRLFKGRTELVPTKGWTWIQLRLVPTEDLDGCVWGPEDLLSQFIANPCFQDALICIAPHWQGNPLNNEKEKSTVLAAIIDEDNSICQNALTHRDTMPAHQNANCPRMLSSAIGAEAHMMEETTTTNATLKPTKCLESVIAHSSVFFAKRQIIMQDHANA
ncbi:hypothetical protein V8E53_008822 [Lactarius tabidus]